MTRAENNTIVPGPISASSLQCPQCGDSLPLQKASEEEIQNGILYIGEHCNGTAKVQVRDFIVSWENNPKAVIPTVSEIRQNGGLGLKRTEEETKRIQKADSQNQNKQQSAKLEAQQRDELVKRKVEEAEGRTREDKEAEKAAREAEKEERKQKQEQQKAAEERQREAEKRAREQDREAIKDERKRENNSRR